MSAALVERLDSLGVVGYTPAEVGFVRETMAQLRPALVVEWGTNVGHSARMFHEARLSLGLDCELHSVDSVDLVPILRSSDKGRERGAMAADCGVIFHVGDGAAVAVRLARKRRVLRPLFFLDTSHEEAETYEHLSLLAEMIPGAVLLVHDVSFARSGEPERALRRFLAEHEGYEIAEVSEGQSMVRLWPRPT